MQGIACDAQKSFTPDDREPEGRYEASYQCSPHVVDMGILPWHGNFETTVSGRFGPMSLTWGSCHAMAWQLRNDRVRSVRPHVVDMGILPCKPMATSKRPCQVVSRKDRVWSFRVVSRFRVVNERWTPTTRRQHAGCKVLGTAVTAWVVPALADPRKT